MQDPRRPLEHQVSRTCLPIFIGLTGQISNMPSHKHASSLSRLGHRPHLHTCLHIQKKQKQKHKAARPTYSLWHRGHRKEGFNMHGHEQGWTLAWWHFILNKRNKNKCVFNYQLKRCGKALPTRMVDLTGCRHAWQMANHPTGSELTERMFGWLAERLAE